MWNKLNKSMMICQFAFGFSFYGVMAILTRFFLEDLKYSEADTMMVVGAFSAIGPLFALAGGVIADKFLGAYRSLTLAFSAFSLGYVFLIIGSSIINVSVSLVGIALASYARGMMSPSYASLFKRTFNNQEDFEKGFPTNYSINNVGALLGQYLFPLLAISVGFYGGFLSSCSIAICAMIVLLLSKKSFINIGTNIDKEKISRSHLFSFMALSFAMISLVFFMFSNMDIGKNIVYAIGLGAIIYFIFLMLKAKKSDMYKMGTILIMFCLSTVFFVYYGQMMTSMTLVSINTMRGDLFGFIPIAPEANMSMNPFWCMIAGPVIAFSFGALEKRNIHLSTSTKVAISFIFTAMAFGILTLAVKNIGEDIIIRPEIYLIIHFFQAFAEVIVGSLVVAFILSVTPKRIENFSVSLFSVSIALSGIIGAVLSTSMALEKDQEITQDIVKNIYGNYFGNLTLWAIVMVVVALASTLLIRKMLAMGDD